MRNTIELWKKYAEMTDLGEIARRYFVMNFFDGVLTVLGVIIGFFVYFLDGNIPHSSEILISGLSVSVAIGISGITGGYLAEKAERKKNILDIHRSMVYAKIKTVSKFKKPILKESDYYPDVKINPDEPVMLNGQIIERIKVDPESPLEKITDSSLKENRTEHEDDDKTINEKAQAFATNFASLINGLAPAAGGIIGIIPFSFIDIPDVFTFIVAFLIIALTLFLLGYYLARISRGSIWKYGLLMISAGLITAAISMLLG